MAAEHRVDLDSVCDKVELVTRRSAKSGKDYTQLVLTFILPGIEEPYELAMFPERAELFMLKSATPSEA